MFGEKFKKAREYLGFSRNAIAKKANVAHSTVGRIELNKVDNPNWNYIQYLVEQGINPYYLLGKSKDITGYKVDVKTEDYEALQEELAEVKMTNQKLEEKQGWMEQVFKLLKIDIDGAGNIYKKDE